MKISRFLASTLVAALAVVPSITQAVTTDTKLHVLNRTGNPITVNVTYYTALCRDDIGKQVLTGDYFQVNKGLCRVKAVSATMKASSNSPVTCAALKGTGTLYYRVEAAADMKSCTVLSART